MPSCVCSFISDASHRSRVADDCPWAPKVIPPTPWHHRILVPFQYLKGKRWERLHCWTVCQIYIRFCKVRPFKSLHQCILSSFFAFQLTGTLRVQDHTTLFKSRGADQITSELLRLYFVISMQTWPTVVPKHQSVNDTVPTWIILISYDNLNCKCLVPPRIFWRLWLVT